MLQEKNVWTKSKIITLSPSCEVCSFQNMGVSCLAVLVVTLIVVHIQGNISTCMMMCRCSWARTLEIWSHCMMLVLLLQCIYIEPIKVLICHLKSMLILLCWESEHKNRHFRLVVLITCMECFKFQVEHFEKKVGAFIKHLEVLFPILTFSIGIPLLEVKGQRKILDGANELKGLLGTKIMADYSKCTNLQILLRILLQGTSKGAVHLKESHCIHGHLWPLVCYWCRWYISERVIVTLFLHNW